MMDKIFEIIIQVIQIAGKMAPYLLLGFLFAGIMHAFIPSRMYSRYLSGNNFRSVLYAALFGVPLPLCSCGVIPTAMSLKKEGASKGATVSFLIATPQTGVDSIAATYSLMGLPFAILRPVAALCTSLLGGSMVNLTQKNEKAKPSTSSNNPAHSTEKIPFLKRCVMTLKYGYVDMMQDIGKWLVLGLVIAGLITALVPDSFFAIFKGNTLLSMLLVLCLAIPMYVCATGSIPIALALMMKGLTPGAALVLLMAGPACNMASVLVVNKVLGKKTLITYLVSIVLGSIVFGYVIDYLLPSAWFMPDASAMCHHHAMHTLSWFSVTCMVVLFLLLTNALILYFKRPSCAVDVQEPAIKEFTIKGMFCNHCKKTAENAIYSLSGVENVEVDVASGKAIVKGKVSYEEIAKVLDPLGFTIER